MPPANEVGETLEITGTTAVARAPEGATAQIEVRDLVQAIAAPAMTSRDLVLPDGVRVIFSRGGVTVFVWEIPPQRHCVRWIEPDAPAPSRRRGAKVTYRRRTLALPFVIVFAVFITKNGHLELTSLNEAFFRTDPLESVDDPLMFPALLNVSKYEKASAARRPLAWICTQHMERPALPAEAGANERVRKGLLTLRRTLFEAAFNFSSEQHEEASWWTVSAKTIPEVADVERWERRSAEDPLFVLRVPWLEAEWDGRIMTVRTLVERIFDHAGARRPALDDARALARIVFNGSRAARGEGSGES